MMRRPMMPPALAPLLAPLVPLYRLGLALREFRLRTGLEPVSKLRWPVMSVGNLSTGGAGKTPLTIALAKALAQRGVPVDVLSRGYGRSSSGAARVDPDGSAEEFGDEPILIARATGAPVYVAARRYEAGLLAERDRPADSPAGVHLLDDGFQHRQLDRALDILLVGSDDLNQRLLPAGNLREPLSAMRRADILAIPAQKMPGFEDVLRNRERWQGPIWGLKRAMDVPPIDGPVIAFCGIARPEQFFEGLRSAGLRPAECIAFPDHHRYTQRDLDRLRKAARNAGAAAFITTEKDQVRLGKFAAALAESCPLKAAGFEIEIEAQDAAIDWLMDRLSSYLRKSTE